MTDHRPANCRFRLQEEGKPYPKSSCTACGRTIVTGLGPRCHREADLIPRADAELAVAEAIRRAADEADKHYANGDMGNPGHWIRALAPADALAEVQRLRAELHLMKTAGIIEVMVRNPSVADYVQHWEGRTLKAEAERDAALARVEKLREAGLGLKSIVEGIQGAMEHGTWRAERSNLRMKDTDEWVTFYNVLAALDEDARHG